MLNKKSYVVKAIQVMCVGLICGMAGLAASHAMAQAPAEQQAFNQLPIQDDTDGLKNLGYCLGYYTTVNPNPAATLLLNKSEEAAQSMGKSVKKEPKFAYAIRLAKEGKIPSKHQLSCLMLIDSLNPMDEKTFQEQLKPELNLNYCYGYLTRIHSDGTDNFEAVLKMEDELAVRQGNTPVTTSPAFQKGKQNVAIAVSAPVVKGCMQILLDRFQKAANKK